MAKRATRKKTTKKKTTKRATTRGRKKTTKRTTTRGRKKTATDLIISKSRTKAASGLNVSSDFYTALDASVRELINTAEARAENNGRRTLRPHDL
jgi:hypothetical protein